MLQHLVLSAAPIATPTAIHTGSFVSAKTAAPIAVPTPIQFPALTQLLNVLFIFIDPETTNGLLDHVENPLRECTSNVKG